jgi:hypothetical protein
MDGATFNTPVSAYDLRNTRLGTVDDALEMILSERFKTYRYARDGTERSAWTNAFDALIEGKARPSPEAIGTARGALVRLLAFARRFLDQPDEHAWGVARLP